MADPLRDPKYSDRWYGFGAVGRYFAGPQSDLPPAPIDYGIADPADYGDFVDWEQQPFGSYEGDIDYTDIDYLNGWDYKAPPVDGNGVPLDPQGNPLPEGALQFDPNGDPWFGEGWQGYWKGVQHRWNADVVGVDIEDREYLKPIMEGDFAQFFGNTFAWLGDVAEASQNIGEEGEDPNFGTKAGRGIGIALGTLLEVADYLSKVTEQNLGAVGLTLEELGRDSPLAMDEIGGKPNNIRFPDWIPEWAEGLNALNPGVLAANAIRTFTSPGMTWDKVAETFDKNYEAARIAYSVWGDDALKEEFIRRYQEGENPELLALELQKPWREMAGQILYDPLNAVGWFAKGARAVMRISDAEKMLGPAGEVLNVIKKVDNIYDDASMMKKIPELTEAVMTQAKRVRGGIDKLAGDRRLHQLTTGAKRHNLATRVGTFGDFLAFEIGTPDKAMEITKALVMMNSDNADEVAKGVTMLTGSNLRQSLFSDVAMEYGQVTRAMLTNSDGVLDFDGFLKGMAEAKEKGAQALIDFMDKKTSKVIDNIFPTVLEQSANQKLLVQYTDEVAELVSGGMEAGKAAETARAALNLTDAQLVGLQTTTRLGDVSPAAKFFARADRVGQKLYRPVNKLFANVYMGANPGFAVRNGLNNIFTGIVDEGVGFTEALFSAGKRNDRTIQWLGGRTPRKFGQGFSAAAGEGLRAEDGFVDLGKLNTLRWSETIEKVTGDALYSTAINDAMMRLLKPGKGLPHNDDLIKAGFGKDTADHILGLIVEHKGDTKAVTREVAKYVKAGVVELKNSLSYIQDADRTVMQSYGNLYDEFAEIVRTSKTHDEYLTRSDELWKRLDEVGQQATKEVPHITDDLPYVEEIASMDTAKDAGHISEVSNVVTRSRFQANQNAFDAYKRVVDNIGGEAVYQARANGLDAGQIDKLVDGVKKELAKLHGDLIEESKAFTAELWRLSNNSGKEWKNARAIFGEDAPPITGAKAFRDYLWDVHRPNIQIPRWGNGRDMYAARVEKFIEELSQAIPNIDPNNTYSRYAREALLLAQEWDDVLPFGKEQWAAVSDVINTALQRGNNGNAIRYLASKYGVASATKTGKPFDAHIFNSVKKYGDVGDATKLDELTIEQVHQALEARFAIKNPAGKSPIPDLNKYLGRGEVTPIAKTFKTKFDEFLSTPRHKIDPVASQALEEEAYNMLALVEEGQPGKRLFGDDGKFSHAVQSTYPEWYGEIAEKAGGRDAVIRAIKKIIQDEGVDKGATVERLKAVGIETLLDGPRKDPRMLLAVGRDSEAFQLIHEAAKTGNLDELFESFGDNVQEITDWYLDNMDKYLDEAGEFAVLDANRAVGVTPFEPKAIDPKAPPKIGDTIESMSGVSGEIVSELKPASNGAQRFRVRQADGSTKVVQGVSIKVTKVAPDAPSARVTTGPKSPPMPANHNTLPTPNRKIYEARHGIADMRKRIDGQVADNWNKTEPIFETTEMNEALTKYIAEADGRIAQARLLAGRIGEHARDFGLLDYKAKRNINIAASYIFPYHFWYGGTYKNWMKRVVSDPQVIAGYAKYKDALASEHAGAPDWWKNNVNTNEILGLDSKNPLFFNLEATLNPLNGITGADFNDPVRRVNWWTRTLDGIGKFGPSVFTPISMATAFALYQQGEHEAASRWGGRLIPQTATIKSIGALTNINLPFSGPSNEYDPNVLFFSGGIDPYERRRVGRALGTLIEQGQISQEQAVDAAHQQSGPVWEAAYQLALDKRAPGQISSFFFGVGFKGRTVSDISIDQMYRDYYALWKQADTLSSDEFRQAMDTMRRQYPFMDTVLLSRKAGPERDRSLAYNVLGRIPPGQSGDITALLGISDELVSKFYDDKGDLSTWTQSDRDRLMAGVVDLSAILALPDYATKAEWNEARAAYSTMQDEAIALFGDDIWERVDRYYASKGNGDEAKELGERIIAADPVIAEVLDWKAEYIFNDPLLRDYYGGIEAIERYYTGDFYAKVEQRFGDIWAKWDIYNQIKLQDEQLGTKDARKYWEDNPELGEYIEMRDLYKGEGGIIETNTARLAQTLKDVSPIIREDAGQAAGVFPEQALAELQPQPTITWQQYQQVLQPAQSRLLVDTFNGAELPESLKDSLDGIAEEMGMTLDEFIAELQRAYFQGN